MARDKEIREGMALSCGMITMIDDAVGDIMQALKDSGRYDNTVVIFTSDHGDYLGDYGMMLKGALQLRSITRVPFIWSDPRDRRSAVNGSLASTIDIAPSVIERAGLKPYWGIQGKSLTGTLGNDQAVRDELMVEYQDSKTRQGFAQPAVVRTLLTEDHRLSVYRDQQWGELYDLRNDPDESHNRWDDPAFAAVRAELTQRLLQQTIRAADASPRARSMA